MTIGSMTIPALLTGLLDNANVFPPGLAPVESAVGLHLLMGQSTHSWMCGRLLVPSGSLAAVAEVIDHLGYHGTAIRTAVVGDTDPATVGQRIQAFSHTQILVDQVELRIVESPASTYEQLGLGSDNEQVVALEVPVIGRTQNEIASDVARVAELRALRPLVMAKVRCGGVQPGMVPSIEELARFIHEATHRQLPFKATAGLHQPFGGLNATGDRFHGFVNVLAAAGIGLASGNASEIAEPLKTVGAEPFATAAFSGEPINPEVRTHGFVGMGTCSMVEPIQALRAAGWI
jgi:hypothetical protein